MQIKFKEILIALLIFNGFFLKVAKTDLLENEKSINISNPLTWEIIHDPLPNNLIWEKVDKPVFRNEIDLLINQKFFNVKGLGRAVTINSNPYPEISNYVPNAFVEDPDKIFSASLRGISKTRHCKGQNFSNRCIDGVLDIDFNLLNKDNFSFNPKFNLQSLSNRSGGTSFGEGISFGFKYAQQISKKWNLAFGGENLIHFDDTIDLGRNFYLVASSYYPFLRVNKDNPSLIFINFGIGSDFYGYGSNGTLGSFPCLGKPNLTGDGTNSCQLGPIGSITFAFNDRVAFVNEWFGYGYGSGLSFRPFAENNLSLSLYATDYIKGIPSHAKRFCENKSCEPRFYGSISVSF